MMNTRLLSVANGVSKDIANLYGRPSVGAPLTYGALWTEGCPQSGARTVCLCELSSFRG